MATYQTDFSEYTAGVAPSDWTPRIVTAGSAWTVQTVAGSLSGKALRNVKTATDRAVLSWDVIDADPSAAVEVLTHLRVTSVPAATTAGLSGAATRASGTDSASATAYIGQMSAVSTGAHVTHIHEYASGASTVLTSHTNGIVANTWYWMRFRTAGSALKVKRWTGAVEDEPGAWNSEITDSTISAAGWVGAWASRQLTTEWDYFAVGTVGDTAPSPTVDPSPGVRITLTGTGVASLTGLKWAYFAEPDPANWNAPTAQGSTGTTDASGVFEVDLDGFAAVDDVGFIYVSNTDGTVADHKHHAGPVAVIDLDA